MLAFRGWIRGVCVCGGIIVVMCGLVDIADEKCLQVEDLFKTGLTLYFGIYINGLDIQGWKKAQGWTEGTNKGGRPANRVCGM